LGFAAKAGTREDSRRRHVRRRFDICPKCALIRPMVAPEGVNDARRNGRIPREGGSARASRCVSRVLRQPDLGKTMISRIARVRAREPGPGSDAHIEDGRCTLRRAGWLRLALVLPLGGFFRRCAENPRRGFPASCHTASSRAIQVVQCRGVFRARFWLRLRPSTQVAQRFIARCARPRTRWQSRFEFFFVLEQTRTSGSAGGLPRVDKAVEFSLLAATVHFPVSGRRSSRHSGIQAQQGADG